MERVYDGDVDKDVRFFVGNEVERLEGFGFCLCNPCGFQCITCLGMSRTELLQHGTLVGKGQGQELCFHLEPFNG